MNDTIDLHKLYYMLNTGEVYLIYIWADEKVQKKWFYPLKIRLIVEQLTAKEEDRFGFRGNLINLKLRKCFEVFESKFHHIKNLSVVRTTKN